MNDSNNNITLISTIFCLDPDQIESCDCFRRKNETLINIKLKDGRPSCPFCGNEIVKIKGYVRKKINHSVLTEQSCILNYHARRYVCPVCGRTYYEANPFVFHRMKISSHVVLSILKELQNPSQTFTSVAERYKVSPTTAASIFDKSVNIPRAKLPAILSTDENYAFHSKTEDSKYICVIINQQNGQPVDILPSRRYEYLDKYYAKIPEYEKKGVRYVVTDMYEPYRRIFKKHLPHAIHVVDHYHIAQELHRCMDSVRLRVMNQYRCINTKYRTQEQQDAYYLLKHHNNLLFRHYTRSKGTDKKRLFDFSRKKAYNQHFKKYMNPYDIAIKLISIHPDIGKAWELKDEVTDFYITNTLDTAPEALNAMIRKLRESGIDEMVKFSYTMFNWKKEIINSFTVSKAVYSVSKNTGEVTVEKKRISNALMENRNGIIKLITKAANGYTNWERFRNRCMLVLEKNITFEINKKDGSVHMTTKKEPDS